MDFTDKELAVQVELAQARFTALNMQGRALSAEIQLTKIAVDNAQENLRGLLSEQEKRAKTAGSCAKALPQ